MKNTPAQDKQVEEWIKGGPVPPPEELVKPVDAQKLRDL